MSVRGGMDDRLRVCGGGRCDGVHDASLRPRVLFVYESATMHVDVCERCQVDWRRSVWRAAV